MRTCWVTSTGGSGVWRFVARGALDQHVDLAGVVRLMFADVEPFAEIICRTPEPRLVDRLEPSVVAPLELGERFLADLAESVQVEVEVVALDGRAAGVAEVHGRIPLVLDLCGPTAPFHAFEGVALVVGLGGGEVEEQSSDRVGVLVEEPIKLRLRQAVNRAGDCAAHPRQLGDEGADLRCVARTRAEDIGLDGGCVGSGEIDAGIQAGMHESGGSGAEERAAAWEHGATSY